MTPVLSGSKMDVKRIGGVEIFRPRLVSEQLARSEAETHLREGYASGTYTDTKKINEILQYQFSHFYGLLKAEIAKSSSRHLMEFLLGQYDFTAQIVEKQKAGQLSSDERTYWSSRGPIIRRALKHLAEIVAMLAPPETPNLDPAALPLNLDTIMIAGEMLVELYVMSDQTHGLHPDETTLTIHPEGGLDYLSLNVKDFERYRGLSARIGRDTARQSMYLAGKPLRYDLDYQASELDAAFKGEFGFTYKQGVQALQELIDKAVVPDPGSFDVPFARRELMTDRVVELTGAGRASVDRFIAGFSLTKGQLEGRLIFKPKQEYRALRRGFFEMPHETGPHLVWSRCMARECLLELMKGTLFQRCPSEWKAPGVNKALATLQNKGGNWFEAEVDRNMAVLGAQGKASLKGGIGVGADRVAIPADIGEIDYLSFLPAEGLLTLLEDKMVDGGFEPTYFRDDLSSFVTGKKPYADQLKRKVEWVRNNLAAVSKGLSSLFPGKPLVNPTRVAGALVTLHPTYASYFISDYPCVPLTELMDDYKAKGVWPYDIGVSKVP
ncbi:hypothetical protein [Fimbriiglobus ruber]|uniref:Uncharacterized protein n=1 Tax=Fimbriiglobus ruber TaxID=1908690 RepID=A0A225DMH4_9BACT|nr:hypothetical protein [Fimbriiglobus ruber]OWK37397.1 hypothetical protein FRUB_06517 [Fimbriiglobus ruber]